MKLATPNIPDNIPLKSQWLAGIGAGSWFHILQEGGYYRIKRFSKKGDLECDRIFDVVPKGFDITQKYKFTYLSHCKQCTLIQNDKTYKFFANGY